MAVADVTIHRNTLTPELDNATLTLIPFDTQVEQDAIFTMNAGNDQIDVSTAGHYLVGYSMHSTNALNSRHAARAEIMVNGSAVTGVYGSVSSYNRDTLNNHWYLNANTILDLAANDDVGVGTIRTGTTAGAHPLTANRAGLWMVKLSDTAAYCRLSGPSGSQTLTQTSLSPLNLRFANNDEVDTGFVHLLGATDIRISDAGLYLVCYSFKVTSPGAGRIEIIGNLTLDGVLLNESRSARNLRFLNGTNEVTLAATCVVRTTASQTLRLQARQEFDTAPSSGPTVDEVSITVMKLESDIDVLRQPLAPTGTQEANPSTATVIDYDAPTEIDSATFTEVGGRVTCVKAGHYLFTCNIESERTDQASGTRQTQSVRVRTNATNLQWGGGGGYNRGNQGSEDTFISGSMNSVLTDDLKENDIIDFTVQQEGNTGTGTLDIARGGMTAFRIEDLGGVTEVDVDHTTDVLIQAGINVVHTTDTLIQVIDNELVHSTDILCVVQIELVHSTDVLIKAFQDITHSTDVLIKSAIDVSHLTDVLVKAADIVSHTTDLLIQISVDTIHTTDLLIQEIIDVVHTTDTLIQVIDNDITHTTDIFIAVTKTLVQSTDVLIKADFNILHTTDILIQDTFDVLHTTDVLVQQINDLVHTTDISIIAEIDKSHTTDIYLVKVTNLIHTTDILVLEEQNITHTTDVFVDIESAVTHSTDVLVQVLDNDISHTTDILVQVVDNDLTHTTDTLIFSLENRVHTTDILIQSIIDRSHTTDIFVSADGLVVHTTDILIKELDKDRTHSTDILIGTSTSLNHNTDILVQISDIDITHTTDTLVKVLDNTLIHSTDVFVFTGVTETDHSTDVFISIGFPLDDMDVFIRKREIDVALQDNKDVDVFFIS